MVPHQNDPNLAGALFVWPGQALYLGLGLDSSLHRHHALQIGVALEPGLWVGQGEELEPCFGFGVYPNVPHQVSAGGVRLVSVWSERDGVGSEVSGLKVFAQPALKGLQAKLEGLKPHTLDCFSARKLLDEVLALAGTPPVAATLDPRVLAVMQAARTQVLEPRPIAELTRQSGLSAGRLRHLFREQVGLSLQRYLLWQRLFQALELASGGLSLTEAAHAAGFADSSHLTRAYRETFGLKPSEVFTSHSVQVRLCRNL